MIQEDIIGQYKNKTRNTRYITRKDKKIYEIR